MKKYEMDLCTGSLWKKIFMFSVPLMFTNILQVVFNMSDLAVVGNFVGPIALGAVGSTSILVTLFTGVLIGLAGGINAVTALFIGSGNKTEMNYPGASPQASFATTAHPCLDASDTCLSPRSARSRKRGI